MIAAMRRLPVLTGRSAVQQWSLACNRRNLQSSVKFNIELASYHRPFRSSHDEQLLTRSRQYHTSSSDTSHAANPPITIPPQRRPQTSRTDITITGTAQEFSAILLRDLCQCKSCVHESTNQRLYSTADIPSNIEVSSIITSPSQSDAVDIRWSQDVPGFDDTHTTTLKLDLLKSINESGIPPSPFTAPLPPAISWGDEASKTLDCDYEAYMQDDAALHQVIHKLQTHGLVFITNVPGIEKSVSTVAERIGPVKDTFYGHTWDVRTVPQAINAAYTSSDLGFHTDLLYFENPPHVQLLHCMQSSSSGGASVFVDGFRAAEDLYETDVEAFNILATLPVNYHYKHPTSNLYAATKPVFDLRPLRVGVTAYATLSDFIQACDENQQRLNQPSNTRPRRPSVFECLEKINWGPPFMAPFSLDHHTMEHTGSDVTAREGLNRKVEAWHAAARKFNALLHRPATLYERLMRPGECVLFNNTRVLHSRRAFEADDVGKPRWLRGTYVDKDPFFSKLRVLAGRF